MNLLSYEIKVETEYYKYLFTYYNINIWFVRIDHHNFLTEHHKDYFYRTSDSMTRELRKMLDKNKNIIHNKTLLIKYVTDCINENEHRLLEEQRFYFGTNWLV